MLLLVIPTSNSRAVQGSHVVALDFWKLQINIRNILFNNEYLNYPWKVPGNAAQLFPHLQDGTL